MVATLPIRKYPDPILRRPTDPVKQFDQQLAKLLDQMKETMYRANGIGLAAPQIGDTRRICVVDVSEDGQQPLEFINPRIVTRAGKIDSEEGCLSIPEYRATIKRSTQVTVEAQDRQGEQLTLEAEGLLAICLQHEIDHLEGVLFVDHLSRLKRELFKRWFKERGPFE